MLPSREVKYPNLPRNGLPLYTLTFAVTPPPLFAFAADATLLGHAPFFTMTPHFSSLSPSLRRHGLLFLKAVVDG